MKPFVIYSGLRLALFAVCVFLIGVVVHLFVDDAAQVWIWALVGGAVVSSVLSLKLLARQRDEFAASVQRRAERATAAFDALKASEDKD